MARKLSPVVELVVSFRFEAWHCWPTAPDEHRYLRNRHRHEFHVRAWMGVRELDREREFIAEKRVIRKACEKHAERAETQMWSCEHWAVYLLNTFPHLNKVEVLEDGENGATATAMVEE